MNGIYVASRVKHAPMWRAMRDNNRASIISSWIDEDGEGETADFCELWTRLEREIAGSKGLVFLADVADAPWKGALVEVGIALAHCKPVGIALFGGLEGRTMRPVGSWIHHPLAKVFNSIEDAVEYAEAGTGQQSSPSAPSFSKEVLDHLWTEATTTSRWFPSCSDPDSGPVCLIEPQLLQDMVRALRSTQ